ncbi:hypothetical protein O181_124462, partial [Austropuccinia psidii MF-1]|nr:hypothetical protein [Austropuccinia psidii MF-1]
MSGEAIARPEIVMKKLLDLINHQKTKDMGSSGKETDTSKMNALLSNAASYPYKITYVCQNGKHNPKDTTHKESSRWAEHPELQPSRNQKKYNRQDNDAKSHQTGMTALFTGKTLNSDKSNTLVTDCGATHHMFNSRELFSNFVETDKLLISTSDPKRNLFATGRGTVVINIENKTVLLPNCLYVPHLTRNLISLLEMFSNSLTIIKQNNDFSILDNDRPILHGRTINNLMISNFTKSTSLLTNSSTKIPCWHSRLGHPSNQTLKSMGLPTFEEDHCAICARGKMTLKPFKSHFEAVKEPLDCLHLDL